MAGNGLAASSLEWYGGTAVDCVEGPLDCPKTGLGFGGEGPKAQYPNPSARAPPTASRRVVENILKLAIQFAMDDHLLLVSKHGNVQFPCHYIKREMRFAPPMLGSSAGYPVAQLKMCGRGNDRKPIVIRPEIAAVSRDWFPDCTSLPARGGDALTSVLA